MRYHEIANPVRPFVLIEDDQGRLSSGWPDQHMRREMSHWTRDPSLRADLAARLGRYFAGENVQFNDEPTPAGGEFFRACWDACRAIPRGETISYGELSRRAGGGAEQNRVAGQAMRRNPLPVIVPCHRVVAADGRLHGFSGGQDPMGPELSLKRALLALEGWRGLEAETGLFDAIAGPGQS